MQLDRQDSTIGPLVSAKTDQSVEPANLPDELAKWASTAVAEYRHALFWPKSGNTHETIVRVYLLNKLAAAGFQVRIEVARKVLQTMLLEAETENSMKGNRGGADIVFGKQGKISGLIEVKRGFPNSAGDIDRVLEDVRRLQEFGKLAPDIVKYVVVVLGAAWAKRSKVKVEEGLHRWRGLFGSAILAEEREVGMTANAGNDCWVSLVLDASQVAVASNKVAPSPILSSKNSNSPDQRFPAS